MPAMRFTARIAILIAIAALVVAVAIPFRRVAPKEQLSEDDSNALERRIPGRGTAIIAQPLRVPTAATGVAAETTADLPSLPPSYHRKFSPVGALLNPPNDPSDEQPDAPQLLATGVGGSLDRTVTHKIADGDTLAALAEHHLGDAKRWPELFEQNREVLKNPDLLPIGQVIKIPPRENVAVPVLPQLEPVPALAPIPRGAFNR